MPSITENTAEIKFTPNGYPINPVTGQMYTWREIVSDAAIPYPKHVDPNNPGSYWQRRSQADFEAAAKKRATKDRRNEAARQRQGHSNKRVMDNRLGWATLTLVERVNTHEQPGAGAKDGNSWGGDKIEAFVAETAPVDPLAADPDETDGPRNMAESIMDLLGQDYKAARKAATRIAVPTAAESRHMLDAALRPDRAQLTADRRAQFGRGR